VTAKAGGHDGYCSEIEVGEEKNSQEDREARGRQEDQKEGRREEGGGAQEDRGKPGRQESVGP